MKRKKTESSENEIDKLIHTILWNRTIVRIIRAKRNPKPRKPSSQLREANFVPLGHSDTPSPNIEDNLAQT